MDLIYKIFNAGLVEGNKGKGGLSFLLTFGLEIEVVSSSPVSVGGFAYQHIS
jgi:hypothetical protein